MLITYWCATCRQMLPAPGACPQCRGALHFRATRDDPDDERYGAPRCPTCWLEFEDGVHSCPSCDPETRAVTSLKD